MKTVAIAGASGVVGSATLRRLLESQAVARVIALGRRPLPVEHEKLASRVVDMQSALAMEQALPEGLDLAICALGTTMKKAGSKEAFRAVDLQAVVAFAEAALERGARRFLLVSSVGAKADSKSFYLRTKGEAERALEQLGYEQLTILRPSFIDDQGARSEFRLGERLGLPLARLTFSLLGRERRYAPIEAGTIARALHQLCFDETEEAKRIIDSDRLHALGR